MYTCPCCHTRTFGLWPVLHARPGQVLTCGSCRAHVRVRQPGKILTLAPLVLAQLAGLSLRRSGDNLALDAAVVAVMLSWLFLLIWRGVSLLGVPPAPDGA